jgi:lipoteichoic acid synthase
MPWRDAASGSGVPGPSPGAIFRLTPTHDDARGAAARTLFWAALWLAIVLVCLKAYYLSAGSRLSVGDGLHGLHYLRALAAISYLDVLFVGAAWTCVGAVLWAAGRWRVASRAVSFGFVCFSAFACVYGAASIVLFGVLGFFLTYPLLELVGNLGMLRSSITPYVTLPVAVAFVSVPAIYVAVVSASARWVPSERGPRRRRSWLALAVMGAWVVFGHFAFAADFATRQDRQIAGNAHWVMLSSWLETLGRNQTVRLSDRFDAADLADFEPLERPFPAVPAVAPMSGTQTVRTSASRRPPNVILIVLEAVAARWTSLDSSLYKTTPNLQAEAAGALVFDNFYAHIGRSSNSLIAMLLSAYPKLSYRDQTEEYPRLPGTSLATVLLDRGYRTAFVTPSDLSWARWDTFLKGRGFGEVHDYRDLACSEMISSWGVEDRCMVDWMLKWVEQTPQRPFFVMAWSDQTHHPYEPTPGVPLLDLAHETTPDDYALGRYLNILHETDRHLERLFTALRRAGLDEDTLVVITGDHGQAFGYPHNNYTQGQAVYEEDVHVPLMLWYPRRYLSAERSQVIGGHVDIAPTIADLLALPAAPDWKGHSLLDARHAPRAYFYAAESAFKLGVRERNWKYIFDLREGVDELYNLDLDPDEQRNVAVEQPALCGRLRQRLAAWTEANRRRYEPAQAPGT